MGVKGLWSLIGPAGKPISLDSLDGKILAVDVSIWLNKAAKGMRDQQGRQVYNAHLVLMFHRICKLLFYGIKPIIVFDGGVPELKRETLRARQNRRLMAHARNRRVNDAMVQNFLQSKALEAVTGTKSTIKLKLPQGAKTSKEDMYELPEATNSQSESSGEEDCVIDEDWLDLEAINASKIEKMFQNPENVDINSEEFSSLPAEIRHDLLVEVKQAQRRKGKRRKRDDSAPSCKSKHFDIDKGMLPEEASNFSAYQIQHLQNRGQITQKINQLRKDMNDSVADEFLNSFCPNKFDPRTSIIEARKMMSDSSRRILFVKHGKKSTDANKLFETDKLDDDYARFKQKEQQGNEHCFMKLGREPAKLEVEKPEYNVECFASDDSSGDETKYIEDRSAKEKPNKSKFMETNLSSDDSDEDEWIEVKDAAENSHSSLDKMNKIQNVIAIDSDGNDDSTENPGIGDRIKEKLNRIEELLRKKAKSSVVPNGKRARESSDSLSDTNTLNNETWTGVTNKIDLVGKEVVHKNTILSDDCEKVSESSQLASGGEDESCVVESSGAVALDYDDKADALESGDVFSLQNPEEKPAQLCNKPLDSKSIASEINNSSSEPELSLCVDNVANECVEMIKIEDDDLDDSCEQKETPAANVVNKSAEIIKLEDDNLIDSSEQKKTQVANIVPNSFEPNSESNLEVQENSIPETNKEEEPKKIDPPVSAYVETFTDSVNAKSREDLQQMQTELDQDYAQLQKETIKQTRQAAGITSDMYMDVQELLRLFGVPYLISPQEAEAQCAHLELMNLSNGSITDDGDVFLFGGKVVYRNIFNKNKYAELYDTTEIESILHLNRKKLIALAFLTGSDYTLGLHGVGGVTAMEILHAFHNPDPEQTLDKFKTWLKSGKEVTGMVHPVPGLKSKLKDVEVPTSFNFPTVWDGYLKPEVDKSEEQFEWGLPDEMSIKQFAKDKFNWQPSHTAEILVPVIKRLTERCQAQKTINRYFAPQPQLTGTGVKSKRLQKILNAAGNLGDEELAMIGDQLDPIPEDKKAKSSKKEPTTSKYFSDTTSEYFDDPLTDFEKPKRKSPMKKGSTPTKKIDLTSTTKSSSEKVQAQKVQNLMNAAAEGFKPLPPMIRMNMMNKAVNNRLKGKKVQPKKRGARQKAATALLNDANTIRTSDAPKPLNKSPQLEDVWYRQDVGQRP